MSDLERILSNLSNEEKEKLVSFIQESIKPSQNTPSTPSTKVEENFTVSKVENHSGRRKEPVKARENKWKDEGEFRDVETPNFEKTPRRRQPPKKVNVECSVCGKSFKADSRFVYGEYHRCNRCTGR